MANESREPQAERGAKQQERPAEESAPRSLEPVPFTARRPARVAGDVSLTRDQWKERAGHEFDASPHAVAGALAHHDPAEEISRSDVQAALDDFAVRRGV